MNTVRPHRGWIIAVAAFLILGLAAIMGVAGCGEADERMAPSAGGVTVTSAAATATTVAGVSYDEDGAPSYTPYEHFAGDNGTGTLASLTAASDQKVITDGTLEIEVEKGKFQTVFDQARMLADRYGGYIINSNSYASAEEGGESSMKSGTVALRIPSASFNQAVTDAKKLGEVQNEQIQSQDVTEEYVDLKARIKNSEAYVQTLLSLLDKAKTVDEILQVQSTLTYAQEELERLKGRLRYLDEHTSYSTLTMTIYETGTEVEPQGEWGFVSALKKALHNFVDAINAIVRGLGVLIPVLIILAIIAYIVFRIVRAILRRNRKREQAVNPDGVYQQQAAPSAGAPAEAGPDDRVQGS